ncbi:MAG: formyltransferase family protein [Candidatus Shikimatogenerans sp. Tcar]|uniref:Formyltransferase family protein n=1 Tax=Candidatus Shikimatogenerans sp. Tcar TaxID=3158565 RepID=A0AAU7QSZ4_9FLAO
MKKYNIIILTNGNFSINILNFLKNNYYIKGIITNKYLFKNKNYIYKFIKKNQINYLYDKYINNKKKILLFLKKNNPHILICVSFKFIKEYVYKYPKYGTINIHPSLLPKYVGPNPIRYSILNNDKYTGISILKINNKIDKGNILIQKKIKIDKKDNYYTLFKKLSYYSIFPLKKILNKIFNKIKINKIKINNNYIYTKKIYHKDGKINWNNKCININNKIKAFYKSPLAWTKILLKNYKTKKLIIKKSKYKIIKHIYPVGHMKIYKNFLKIFCKNGYLIIKKCKFSNKKQFIIKKFINGLINLNIIKCI